MIGCIGVLLMTHLLIAGFVGMIGSLSEQFDDLDTDEIVAFCLFWPITVTVTAFRGIKKLWKR